jgi:O-antigen/teichoic acid export membrane protein
LRLQPSLSVPAIRVLLVVPSEITGLPSIPFDNQPMNSAGPAPRESADRLSVSRRRIAVNFLTLAGTNVFGLLVTVLISVYVRRAMGPEAIGQVSWAMAAIAYLTALVSPGLTFVGQRELAQSPERSQSLIALVLSLQTLLACIVYAFVLVAASFEPRGAVVSTLLAIQGVTLFVTAWNTGWALQAHERMVAPSLAALAFNILQLPALMLLVHGPDDLTLYAVLVVAFAFGSVFFNILYLARRGILHPFRLRPTLAGAHGLVREAWPLALTQAALLVIANSGALLLGFTHGDDAVGQFVSAYRLMLVANVVTAALWNAYFPAFVRAEKRPEQAVPLSREYLGLLVWMGLPTAALGWALGRHVVELLYGAAFAPAGRYFEWLCLAIALNFINYGVISPLVPWGRGGLQLRMTASAAALNLLVTAVAVPLYGPWGAVAAIFASEIVGLILGIIVRRRLRLFWHPVLPAILPAFACSSAVAMVLLALPHSLDRLWWLQLAIAAVLIGLCMLAVERHTVCHAWRTFRSR